MDGYEMLQIVKKLKILNKSMKELNRGTLKNIVDEVEELREKLEQAQRALHQHPNDSNILQQERETFLKFRETSYRAEVFRQQTSKATWLKLGDDNTRYFYSVIKHRRIQQAII